MSNSALLKDIRRNIDEGKYEQAKVIVEDLLSNNLVDYHLYVFAAVVYDNLGDSDKSCAFYRKALAIDETKLLAWQGLNKLLSKDKLAIDEFALIVIEKILSFDGTTPQARRACKVKRGLVLFHLKMIGKVCEDADLLDDLEFCKMVLEFGIPSGQSLSGMERRMFAKCFETVVSHDEDDKWKLKELNFAISIAESEAELRETILCRKSSSIMYDCGVMEHLRSLLVVEFLRTFVLDEEILEIIQQDNVEAKEFETMLKFICSSQLSELLKLTEGLSKSSCKWPTVGLTIVVLYRSERFDEVLSEINDASCAVHRSLLPEIDSCFALIKAKCYLKINDEESLVKLKHLIESRATSGRAWRPIHLELLVSSAQSTENVLSQTLRSYSDFSTSDIHYWKARFYYNHGRLSDAEDCIRLALESDPDSWIKNLLLAEIRCSTNHEDFSAVPFLIKAAKLNPYSSQVFYLLGVCTLRKSKVKALISLERALKICSKHDKAASLYDEILYSENKTEERLTFLQTFLCNSPCCKWAQVRHAVLQLRTGKTDDAVANFQKLVRLYQKDSNMWKGLGDAYKMRGNVRSAIKAYKTAISCDPNHVASRIKLCQAYHIAGQLNEALEECEWLNQCDQRPPCASLLHIQTLWWMMQSESCSVQYRLLNELFCIVEKAMNENPTSLMARKFSADSLMICLKFHTDTFSTFQFPHCWNIQNQSDVGNVAIHFYYIVVKNHSTSASWNDLGIALLRKGQITADKSCAFKAIKCFKNAISMGQSSNLQSSYWTNLSRAVDFCRNRYQTRHCLVRALMLNERNDIAWCLLGLLYIRCKMNFLAREALNVVQVLNPKLAETWCALGILAATESRHDSEELFCHSLSLKPTEVAIKHYSYCVAVMQSKRTRTDNEFTLVNFMRIADFYGISSREEEITFSIAVLAEHFGYLACSLHYIQLCGSYPGRDVVDVYKQRLSILMDNYVETNNASLKWLSDLCHSSTTQLYEKLSCESSSVFYNLMYTCYLCDRDQICSRLNYKRVDRMETPLFISSSICLKKEVNEDFIKALKCTEFRHRLLNAFVLEDICCGANEIHSLSDMADGCQITSFDDYLIQRFYELLLVRNASSACKSADVS